MHRVVVIPSIGTRQRDRWVGGYRWAASQPGWIMRFTLVAFLLIVAVPLLALLILAVVAAVVLGGVLGVTNAVVSLARGKLRRLVRTDGRSNVRVIQRDKNRAP